MERRNIGVLAHVDAGKTTITEWLLHYGNVIRRPGSVDAGTTVTDWLEEEQQRGITIGNSACRFVYDSTIITIIDTPGHVDFGNEVDRSLQVIDGGVLVISAYDGVQPQTEAIWARAKSRSLPCIAVINKADKLQYSLESLLKHLTSRLGVIGLPLEVAKLDEANVLWVMCVFSGEIRSFPEGESPEIEVIDWLLLEREIALEHILNHLAFYSEELTERLLAGKVPQPDEIKNKISKLIVNHPHYLPYQYAVGKFGFNISSLLRKVVSLLPSPSDIKQIPLESLKLREWPDGVALGFIYKTELRRSGEFLAHLKVLKGEIQHNTELYLVDSKEVISGYRLVASLGKDSEPLEELAVLDVGCLRFSEEYPVLAGSYVVSTPHSLKIHSSFHQTFVESAVEAPTPDVHERMVELLRRAVRHDPSYSLRYDHDAGAFVIAGRGELHIQVLISQIERDCGIKLRVYPAKVREQYHLDQAISLTGKAAFNETTAFVEIQLEVSETVEWLFDSSLGEIECAALRAGIEAGLGWDGQTSIGFGAMAIQVTGQANGEICKYPFLWRDAAITALRNLAESKYVELQEPWVTCQMQVPMIAVGRTMAALQRKQINLQVGVTLGDSQVLEGNAPLARILELTSELRDVSSGRTSWTYSPIGYRSKR